ncbi:MAG: hypothetical protein II661_04915 [Bacteroidales bacterium]|nr:hypothetical protein [Bacteroidales bacterium]
MYIGSWVVDFLFAEKAYDTSEVLEYLRYANAPDSVVQRAEQIMTENRSNTGFLYPDTEAHYAVAVVGPTTSGEEFIDTVVHEIHHLAVSIAAELGVDLEGETPAYLSGDSARAFADIICKMGCSRCHQ